MSKRSSRPPLTWWLEKLGIVDDPGKRELFAVCPAHADNGPSLHITKKADGDAVVHCFAGCKYEDILKQLEAAPTVKITHTKSDKKANKPGTELPALEWWVKYTTIPLETWEKLGIAETDTHVCFTFADSDYVKGRLKGTKTFAWNPSGGSPPCLWPLPTPDTPPTILLTEGESDCGVLRHLEFNAYCLTKGSNSELPRSYWIGFKQLGVTKIVAAFDLDKGGDEGFKKLKDAAKPHGIAVERLPLERLVKPFSTEKDLRDLWRRMGLELKQAIEDLLGAKEEDEVFVPLPQQLEGLGEVEWLWEGMIPSKAIMLFTGDPKVGKSTFLFPLFNRMLNGGTIGGRKVAPGRVVYLSEEALQTLKAKHDVHGPLPNVFAKSITDLQSMAWRDICELAGRMARAVEASVICVDTFAAFAGFDSGEENDAAAVSERLSELLKFRGEFTVILVHHTAKSGGTRGSSAIDASVDGILRMTKSQGMNRVLSSVNRIEANEQVICIDPKTGKETIVVGGKITPKEAGPILDQIIDFLSKNPHAAERHIAQALGVARVATHLKRLEKRGLVQRDVRELGNGQKRVSYQLKQGPGDDT